MTKEPIETVTLVRDAHGTWDVDGAAPIPPAAKPAQAPDLASAKVELRTVERRILVIDGKPVGAPFE